MLSVSKNVAACEKNVAECLENPGKSTIFAATNQMNRKYGQSND